MASPFSWTDTLQIAFGSCLPCIKPAADSGEGSSSLQQNNDPTANRIPRARHDELQGLLLDPETDGEAETMSLHSNPGRSRRGKNKKRKARRLNNNGSNHPRSITLFGYSLFGAPVAGVQLPDDGEDALYGDSRPRPRHDSQNSLAPSTILTAHSSSTFDSDAAPLESAAIDALSTPAAIAAAAQQAAEAEAQRQKEKEERRQRRREKKEMKRLAEALALEGYNAGGDDGEFEGFQGSGGGLSKSASGYPRIPKSMRMGGTTASDSGSGSGFSGSAREGFGPFVGASTVQKMVASNLDDEDDDAADLDGGLYANKGRQEGPTSNGSDSRSRTSASVSERDRDRDRAAHQFPDPRNVLARVHHSHSQSLSQSSSSRLNSPPPLQAQFEPQPQPQADPSIAGTRPRSKSKSSRSKSANKSHSSSAKSSTTASQSPSIPSPLSSNFPTTVQHIVSPSTVEQGQGFFDLEDELPQLHQAITSVKTSNEFPSARIGGGGFPVTGFGNGTSGNRTRDFGAFLASRGNDDHGDADGL
ncbi:hypothetical protein D9613_008878 [Agrocybe pediades]|uniref:Uncharacterized protein n=1 Tax=Agrocybe pediades TaxID=84607 RepID=A0A8H4QSZ3_9AGAR|nr:hypothetical protein D9613_008878 [Agrocybe pediades]